MGPLAGGLVVVLLGLAPAAQADTCPNAAIREQQRATGLPDCRAYEQVTPPEKNGVGLPKIGARVTPDGDRVMFRAAGAFGADSQTSLLRTTYRADRGAEGWGVRGFDVLQRSMTNNLIMSAEAVSSDLTKAVVSSTAALTAGAQDDAGNFYLRTTTSGAMSLLTSQPLLADLLTGQREGAVSAASADLGHVLIQSTAALTPDALDLGWAINVYDVTANGIELVSRLPDGAAVSGKVPPVGLRVSRPAANAISMDGSTIFFEGYLGLATWHTLYLRRNGTTVPIGVSQRPGDSADPQTSWFHGASEDGSVVVFSSPVPLTPDAKPGSSPDAWGGLYRYETDTGRLTNLTPTAAQTIDVSAVPAVSPDGAHVNFVTGAALTAGAVEGSYNLYHWHDGVTTLVATSAERGGFTDSEDGETPTSRNGRYVAFSTAADVTGEGSSDPRCGGPLQRGVPL